MYDIIMVGIQKSDVIFEDFTYIKELINKIAKDRNKLLESRNKWEVVFEEYDDDPREIPEIPEVVNWIRKSVDEGIPWFYFMNCQSNAPGLLTFMVAYGATADSDVKGKYTFDRDKTLSFIEKNFINLNYFEEKYLIPDEVGRIISENISTFCTRIIKGELPTEEGGYAEKIKKEAINRLIILEKLFGLNPKVKNYFLENRLYYSYTTAGGYIGSIDTIGYNPEYEKIVSDFSETTFNLVYHVIEYKNTLAVLFVSDKEQNWFNERPSKNGVFAWVIDLDTYENNYGYVKIEGYQGALIWQDTIVREFLNDGFENSIELSDIDYEIVERLNILKNIGLETELDVTHIFLSEKEICFSEKMNVLGECVGIVNRLSTNPKYKRIANSLSKQIIETPYFMIAMNPYRLAFLVVSNNSENWEEEKILLEKNTSKVIVADIKEMTASFSTIHFKMLRGGPICE